VERAGTGQAGLTWRKSSFSTSDGACVEVARSGAVIAVRDSKSPEGVVLLFMAEDWYAFLADIKCGHWLMPSSGATAEG
jgi:Domain of unknown function (DUF397)